MKPIPPEIGQLQCDIDRQKSGLNKWWPRYDLSITGTKLLLLTSKKLANSKTSHYKIDLANTKNKYKKLGEEPYLGRLRGTFDNHQYHLFDTGLKKSEIKPGMKAVERRQYASIIYPPDKFGDKNPRKLEVYLPLITEKQPTEFYSWVDDDLKKENIFFEYNQQKLKKVN